jgi:hypothetical protein
MMSRTLLLVASFWLVILPAICLAENADQVPTSRDLNAWARFPVGSWKLVRTVTQSYDPQGNVTETTTVETQTTLTKVEKNKLTLKIDFTTYVNGRRQQGVPQEVVQGFWGEDPTIQEVKETVAKDSKIVVEGREIPCTVHQASYTDGEYKTLSKQYVSTEQAPFVLKRETITTTDQQPQPKYRTVSEVFALQMPCKIGGDLRFASHERVVRQTPQETLISLDVVVPDVPGGVIQRTTKETDAKGQLLRHSTMEIVSYQVASENEPPQETRRRRLFGRETVRK